MATQPPIKSTLEDIAAIAAYLRTQVGWVPIEAMKKAIPSKHADNRKIEAMRYVGLIERDAGNIKLSPEGREYATGNAEKQAQVLRSQLRITPLYRDTLTWMHFNQKDSVNKTDIANYWHDNHNDLLDGAAGAALTDATMVFMRFAEGAGVGKFIAAGVGRETHLEVDRAALEAFVTDTPAATPDAPNGTDVTKKEPPASPPPQVPPATPQVVGTGIHVNVEIHIAADAKPATIEEIFKNMRKYLIEQPDTANGG